MMDDTTPPTPPPTMSIRPTLIPSRPEIEPDQPHAKADKLSGAWQRFINIARKGREKKGLSQAQVAEIIKVSPDTIKRLESGKAEPGILLIADLVRLLELDILNAIFGQRASKFQNLTEEAETSPADDA